MPLKPSLLHVVLLSGLGYSLSGCEQPCATAVCQEDHDLNIILVDSSGQNLITSGVYGLEEIKMYSVLSDSLTKSINEEDGIVSFTPRQDLSNYTIAVGQAAVVDLTVYQHYAAPPNECCPGFWKVDSVYARQAKLKKSPEKDGFYLELE